MKTKFDEMTRDLTRDEKEELSMGLMYELSVEMNDSAETKAIGGVYWGLMSKARNCYRVYRMIREG